MFLLQLLLRKLNFRLNFLVFLDSITRARLGTAAWVTRLRLQGDRILERDLKTLVLSWHDMKDLGEISDITHIPPTQVTQDLKTLWLHLRHRRPG